MAPRGPHVPEGPMYLGPLGPAVVAGCGCVSVVRCSPVLWLRETLDQVPGVQVRRDAHDLKRTSMLSRWTTLCWSGQKGGRGHAVVYDHLVLRGYVCGQSAP